MMPSVINRPSSITKSRRTPREASSAAIDLAPAVPAVSSSWPNAK